MSTPIVFNGINYFVPAFGDTGYAQGPGNMSAYWIALATGTLQPTGGSFPLTGQVNFGTNFGITALNFISTTTNPATAGTIRLAKTDTIDWRNNANSANLPLGINASDNLTFNSLVFGEYVSSVVAAVPFPASSIYGDLTSISLTAGDWDVSCVMLASGLGGNADIAVSVGISTTPGNSVAGMVIGDNLLSGLIPPTSALNVGHSIPVWKLTIGSPTTVYLKYRMDYSGTTSVAYGRLSARRIVS